MSFLDRLKQDTRWDNIPNMEHGYRLLCNDDKCSLSCANLRNGRLAVTSIHGTERHSQSLSKKEMVLITAAFLNTLSDKELITFVDILTNYRRVAPPK